ncbi:hypothetical protein C8R43DRAFT_903346, partial [Mycena crocata]
MELRLVNTYHRLPAYERQCRYVCSRSGTGGIKHYTRLHPEWVSKIPSKRTGCDCTLLVKQYPGTQVILGRYTDQHNHPLGAANLRFTRIPTETREYIASLLRMEVKQDAILRAVHRGAYDGDTEFDDVNCAYVPTRAEFIQLSDIRRIAKDIEAETIRLHPDDGQSTRKWAEILRANDQLLGFKARTDPPPPGSNLAADVFFLAIQTKWQRAMFRKYGGAILCIDETHNVT